MFDTLLIANRGEIACRVITTARRLGLATVAVYSDADAGARHVAMADTAVRLGAAPARDSYLRGDAILAAAQATGAQAIHPGYGFLSENAGFARACADAGIVFVGPPVGAIEAMGSKSAAKALMERASVPLVPGYHGADQDEALLARAADRIGYPVLIKASAGGGGKGMRIVRAPAEFGAALASCRREAASAFGDDRVLVERYLDRPRHIEIQVFADTHGNAVYLHERDCSVQRRHQKVLEEAPAPGMTAQRRAAMGEAAVAAARAVGYVGAGTVEFIADQAGTFFFMEMNTRLQVEHPVTEMITGHDLVEWQLRVAAGEPLPAGQHELRIHGHALEARVYAENPDRDFLPSIGRLSTLAAPPHVAFVRSATGAGGEPAAVRIDAGVRAGDSITPYYDPMIAKLIVWGEDRAQALARMRGALAQLHIVGVANNVDFLARLVGNPAFAAADLDTGLIERERERLFPPAAAPEPEVLALACARVLADELRAQTADPWSRAQGWRLNTTYTRPIVLRADGSDTTLALEYRRDGYVLHHAGVALPLELAAGAGGTSDAALAAAPADRLALRLAGRTVTGDVVRAGDALHVFSQGRHRLFTLVDPIAQATDETDAGRLTAPMPGKVIALAVSAGQRVTKGLPLLVMEAMKMEHTIVAPADGIVAALPYAVGDQVSEGAELVRFEGAA